MATELSCVCGTPFVNAKGGRRREWCSEDCRRAHQSPCSIDGCVKPSHSQGMCSAHATRTKRFGDPLAAKTRTPQVGECSVDGCNRLARKRGWCASHYMQWSRYGEVKPFQYTWAGEKRCLACGATEWDGKDRKACSAACWQRLHRAKTTVRSDVKLCALCGVEIDLAPKSGERLRRADTFLCYHCRARRGTRHGTSASWLRQRDGVTCGICGVSVDMSLRCPHPGSPSVDHVIPRALGGSDDPSNLQLAHLSCNQIKQARPAEVVAFALGRAGMEVPRVS